MVAATEQTRALKLKLARRYLESDSDFLYQRETLLSESLEQLIAEQDQQPPGFHQSDWMGDGCTIFYENRKEKGGRRGGRQLLRDGILAESEREYTTAERAGLEQAVSLLLKGMMKPRPKGFMEPKFMALHSHYKAEHSLHTAAILASQVPNAKIELLITGLLHDYWEDAANPLGRKQLKQYLSRHLHNSSNLDVMVEALDRLTIRKGTQYTSNIDRLIAEEQQAGPGHQTEQQAIQYALLAKLADKISAIQTLEPFGYQTRLRIFGKTWKVINTARQYLTKHRDEGGEMIEAVERLTTQAAIEMSKAAEREITEIERLLPHLYRKGLMSEARAREEIDENVHVLNWFIRDGRLNVIDQEAGEYRKRDEDPHQEYPDFDRTVRATTIMSMQLNHPSVEIPPQYIHYDETKEQARNRLREEQQTYKRELPNLTLHEYLLDDAEVDGLREKERIRHEKSRFPDEATIKKGANKVHRRLLAFAAAAKKYATQREYCLEGM